MITIPFEFIVICGILACVREGYGVLHGNKKNLGTLFAFSYLTIVYMLLAWGHYFGIEFHGSTPVRAGIFLIFLDKAMALVYEIISRRRKWIK